MSNSAEDFLNDMDSSSKRNETPSLSVTSTGPCSIRNLVDAVAKIRHQKQCATVVRIHKAVRQQLQRNVDVEEIIQQLSVATNNGALWRVDNNGVTSYREPPKASTKDQTKWTAASKESPKWPLNTSHSKESSNRQPPIPPVKYPLTDHVGTYPASAVSAEANMFQHITELAWQDPRRWTEAMPGWTAAVHERGHLSDPMAAWTVNDPLRRQMNDPIGWPTADQYRRSMADQMAWTMAEPFGWPMADTWRYPMVDQFRRADGFNMQNLDMQLRSVTDKNAPFGETINWGSSMNESTNVKSRSNKSQSNKNQEAVALLPDSKSSSQNHAKNIMFQDGNSKNLRTDKQYIIESNNFGNYSSASNSQNRLNESIWFREGEKNLENLSVSKDINYSKIRDNSQHNHDSKDVINSSQKNYIDNVNDSVKVNNKSINYVNNLDLVSKPKVELNFHEQNNLSHKTNLTSPPSTRPNIMETSDYKVKPDSFTASDYKESNSMNEWTEEKILDDVLNKEIELSGNINYTQSYNCEQWACNNQLNQLNQYCEKAVTKNLLNDYTIKCDNDDQLVKADSTKLDIQSNPINQLKIDGESTLDQNFDLEKLVQESNNNIDEGTKSCYSPLNMDPPILTDIQDDLISSQLSHNQSPPTLTENENMDINKLDIYNSPNLNDEDEAKSNNNLILSEILCLGDHKFTVNTLVDKLKDKFRSGKVKITNSSVLNACEFGVMQTKLMSIDNSTFILSCTQELTNQTKNHSKISQLEEQNEILISDGEKKQMNIVSPDNLYTILNEYPSSYTAYTSCIKHGDESLVLNLKRKHDLIECEFKNSKFPKLENNNLSQPSSPLLSAKSPSVELMTSLANNVASAIASITTSSTSFVKTSLISTISPSSVSTTASQLRPHIPLVRQMVAMDSTVHSPGSVDANLRGLVDGLTRFFTPTNKRNSRVSQNALAHKPSPTHEFGLHFLSDLDESQPLIKITLDSGQNSNSFKETREHLKSLEIISEKDKSEKSDLTARGARQREQLMDGLSHFFTAQGKRRTRGCWKQHKSTREARGRSTSSEGENVKCKSTYEEIKNKVDDKIAIIDRVRKTRWMSNTRPRPQTILNTSTQLNTELENQATENNEFEPKSLNLDPKIYDLSLQMSDIILYKKSQRIASERLLLSRDMELTPVSLRIGQHHITIPASARTPQFYSCTSTFICEHCLKFCRTEDQYNNHLSQCIQMHPPGEEVYHHDDYSIYQIDTNSDPTYCDRMEKLAASLIEDRRLMKHLRPSAYRQFYVLTKRQQNRNIFVAFLKKLNFKKEDSSFSYIFVMPAYRGNRLATLLINFYYYITQLSKLHVLTSKPLTAPLKNLLSKYWRFSILSYLNNQEGVSLFSIKEICSQTGICENDVISTLVQLTIFKSKLLAKNHFKMEIDLKDFLKEEYLKVEANWTSRSSYHFHPQYLKINFLQLPIKCFNNEAESLDLNIKNDYIPDSNLPIINTTAILSNNQVETINLTLSMPLQQNDSLVSVSNNILPNPVINLLPDSNYCIPLPIASNNADNFEKDIENNNMVKDYQVDAGCEDEKHSAIENIIRKESRSVEVQTDDYESDYSSDISDEFEDTSTSGDDIAQKSPRDVITIEDDIISSSFSKQDTTDDVLLNMEKCQINIDNNDVIDNEVEETTKEVGLECFSPSECNNILIPDACVNEKTTHTQPIAPVSTNLILLSSPDSLPMTSPTNSHNYPSSNQSVGSSGSISSGSSCSGQVSGCSPGNDIKFSEAFKSSTFKNQQKIVHYLSPGSQNIKYQTNCTYPLTYYNNESPGCQSINQNSPNNCVIYNMLTPSPTNSSSRSFNIASPMTNPNLQNTQPVDRGCPSAPVLTYGRTIVDTSDLVVWPACPASTYNTQQSNASPASNYVSLIKFQDGDYNSCEVPNDRPSTPIHKDDPIKQRSQVNPSSSSKSSRKCSSTNKACKSSSSSRNHLAPNVTIQPGSNVITNYNVVNPSPHDYRNSYYSSATTAAYLQSPHNSSFLAPTQQHLNLYPHHQAFTQQQQQQHNSGMYAGTTYNYFNGSMPQQSFNLNVNNIMRQ